MGEGAEVEWGCAGALEAPGQGWGALPVRRVSAQAHTGQLGAPRSQRRWLPSPGAWRGQKSQSDHLTVDPVSQRGPGGRCSSPLTDVQGHALLGVRLQLVVVDGHLPLEEQGGRG